MYVFVYVCPRLVSSFFVFGETTSTGGSWWESYTLHFTGSQLLMENMILSHSLSRTSCQGNLELRQEKCVVRVVRAGGGKGWKLW